MIVENITEDTVQTDIAESLLQNIDRKVKSTSGLSLFHIVTGLSIAASLLLFLRGKKMEAIFIGLWPPTIQALKSASELRK
jgi:hypothetical protein